MNRHAGRTFWTAALAVLASALLCSAPAVAAGQDKPAAPPDRAKVLAAAREIMTAQQDCGLVMLDAAGRPQIRTMNPFPPGEDMAVYWDTAFPGLKNLVLIKVIPERLEVVHYKQGLGADPVTFRATSISLPAK